MSSPHVNIPDDKITRAAGGLGSLNNLLEPRLITAHNHENKMEGRSKRYKKIDFLGEGQVQ